MITMYGKPGWGITSSLRRLAEASGNPIVILDLPTMSEPDIQGIPGTGFYRQFLPEWRNYIEYEIQKNHKPWVVVCGDTTVCLKHLLQNVLESYNVTVIWLQEIRD